MPVSPFAAPPLWNKKSNLPSQGREWDKIFRDWPRQGTRPEGGNRNQPLFVATSCHLSAPVRPGVETGCRSPVVGGGKLEKDLDEGGGEEGEGESESKESKELFQASSPFGRPD